MKFARIRYPLLLAALALSALVTGCDEVLPHAQPAPEVVEPVAPQPEPEPEPEPRPRVDARPPPMARPVPLWEDGATAEEIDAASADVDGYLLLDLGESWTPYLFTERTTSSEERVEHAYRETYLALARGEHPSDHHGSRAERDKYLELFGIMPTLGLLRERFAATRDLECRDELDLSALDDFDGFVAYRNNPTAHRRAEHFRYLERQVAGFVTEQSVEDEASLDEGALDERERRALREFRDGHARVEAIRATQDRLECEGYFEGKGRWMRGAMDWPTHEALAEFERRHRVYGWGFIGRETLEALRLGSLELERRAVVRVLTERAMHALGVLEDGSAPPMADDAVRTYRGADGERHEVPNLEHDVEQAVVEALGLDTPEGALDFLEGLGELTPDAERTIALRAPQLPEYYSEDMDIRIEIDRGDVWYEFPYDDNGSERSQAVQRRPRTSVVVEYLGQSIPIARFGTTVGGWRSEEHDGDLWWRYKNSPVGERVWHQIVSAPVWMPPGSTPSRTLLSRNSGRSGADAWRVNLHETGPSYASAYGLVAAYHRQFTERSDGTIEIRGDEGIRSHGSVDYMSIMRRHSHGCHRLHNHIAVRLMSWVLAHRAHTREGHAAAGYHRTIEHDGHNYQLDIERGGYVFDLERPIRVQVLEGRVRGDRATPIEEPLPRYDTEAGAYLRPDGTAVRISRLGEMTEYELDAGVPDGSVDADAGLALPLPPN